MQHDWIPSTLGHGNVMCRRCCVTDLEAAAIGMTECDAPPPKAANQNTDPDDCLSDDDGDFAGDDEHEALMNCGKMTQEEYFRLNPESALPTFHGQKPDQGRIVVGQQYPNEGYAIIRCGNTEIQVGYTLLHSLMLRIDKESPVFADLAALQRALHSITCEASLGRKGD